MFYFRALSFTEVEVLVIRVTVAHRVLFHQPVLQALDLVQVRSRTTTTISLARHRQMPFNSTSNSSAWWVSTKYFHCSNTKYIIFLKPYAAAFVSMLIHYYVLWNWTLLHIKNNLFILLWAVEIHFYLSA